MLKFKTKRKKLLIEIEKLKKEKEELNIKINKFIKNKEFVNFDGLIIKIDCIYSITFFDVNIEENVMKPVVVIKFWEGKELKNEAIEFDNHSVYVQFQEKIKEELNVLSFDFPQIEIPIWQKNVAIVPDENGEMVVKSKIIAQDTTKTKKTKLEV